MEGMRYGIEFSGTARDLSGSGRGPARGEKEASLTTMAAMPRAGVLTHRRNHTFERSQDPCTW